MRDIDARQEAARDTPVWEQSGERVPFAAQPARAEVDVAVIGGGLTGLSAALHLARARPGWAVTVYEAARVGGGASGRSTGIVGPGVGTGIRSLARRYGPQVGRRMFRYSQDAVDTVVKLVADEHIECDLTPSAHLLCATTAGQAGRLLRQRQAFTRLGLPAPLITRDELAERLGHDSYLCALEYRPTVLVNPLKLTLGLAGAATRAGAQVAENRAVTGLAPERGATRLRLADGTTVLARMVVIATDGYTPAVLPHGRRLFPVRTHVLATEPLSAPLRAELGWTGREAVIDQRTFFAYYRFAADGRLLFGGGPVCVPWAAPGTSEAIWRRLDTELRRLLPALRDVAVTHRWSGLTCATLDEIPVVGQVPRLPGVYYAGAWRGHGLALSVGCGAWLADRLAEGAGPADGRGELTLPWQRSRTGNPPLGPLRSPAIRAYIRTFHALDRGGALLERARNARRA
jgi:glycine/D-amino acid oxidase-like deaminating enzyme